MPRKREEEGHLKSWTRWSIVQWIGNLLLKEHDVDTFICTSLSTRLMIELARNNIEIVGGVRGNAIREAKKYLLGEVEENDFILDCGDVNCSGDCSKCH